ncbi:MAG: L,D-transpeptidase family protein [Pseudomonadota bacterium]
MPHRNASPFSGSVRFVHGVSAGIIFAAVGIGLTGGASPSIAAERLQLASLSASDAAPRPPRRNPQTKRTTLRGQLKVIVSLPDQRMDVYDGTVRVASTRVSTGKAGHRTPRGIFSIIQKNRRHFSNLYNNAPMPYMQRLTWSGIALHAGAVPRYPASHGCVRMPYRFARSLFSMTEMNVPVIVNAARQRPKVIEHDALFQPRPKPVVAHAAAIQRMTLDNAALGSLIGRDLMQLRIKQADRFAELLKIAHHPNATARPRQHIMLTQRLLGFLNDDIRRPDGDLGPITRRAIRAFQRQSGLKVDGRISPQLTARLYQAVGHKLIDMPAERADTYLVPKGIDEPLRILITRVKPRDQIRSAQQLLQSLGYIVGGVDGTLGPSTRRAIADFTLESGLGEILPRQARVDDALVTALRKAAGVTAEEANGRLLVRQGARDIYQAPISINGDAPLGTHLISSVDFDETGTRDVSWISVSVAEGQRVRKRKKFRRKKRRRSRRVAQAGGGVPFKVRSAHAALSRIDIPADVRRTVEEMMTAGTSVIVTDHGNSHETGEGTDFIVLTK